MKTYYIEVRPYWQGSHSWFIPHKNQRDAVRWYQQATDDPAISTDPICRAGIPFRRGWVIYDRIWTERQSARRGREEYNTLRGVAPTAEALLIATGRGDLD